MLRPTAPPICAFCYPGFKKAPTAAIQRAHLKGVTTKVADELVRAMGMHGMSKIQRLPRRRPEIDQRVKSRLEPCAPDGRPAGRDAGAVSDHAAAYPGRRGA